MTPISFADYTRSIPLKTKWKRIIKRTVLEYETRLWKHRLVNDTDFFQFLQTSIQPSIVYIMCKNSASRNIMTCIRHLWTRSPDSDYSYCEYCNTVCFDNIIHLLTECTRTLELKHSLYLDLLTADPTIHNEFSQLSSFTRYLLLLGANMCPFTHDDDLLTMFLKCSFMYIYKCLCLVSQCGYNVCLT